jgi:A/G-specific adenine glycosylase
VGDYTAAAIASLAFGIEAAAVDGNVYRVLSRLYGIATPINSTEGKKEFQLLADLVARGQDAGRLNQAMMDFGALLCTPKAPLCLTCPLAETCEARRQGLTASLPVKNKTTKVLTRQLTFSTCAATAARHCTNAAPVTSGSICGSPAHRAEGRPGASPLPDGARLLVPGREACAHPTASSWPTLPARDKRAAAPARRLPMGERGRPRSYAVPRLVELLLEAVARHDADCAPETRRGR